MNKKWMAIIVVLVGLIAIICIAKDSSFAGGEKQHKSQILRIWSSEELEKLTQIDLYEGKWKITALIGEHYRARTTYYPQHYLGRTVIIGDETIETSIWYWPFELDWRAVRYEYKELAFYSYKSPWVNTNDWWDLVYDIGNGGELPFIIFEAEDDLYKAHVIILDQYHLAYPWMGGYYLLEPFAWCDIDMNTDDIFGEWKIAFLDSYHSDYEGGFEEIEETRTTYHEKMDELNGSDFYAQDWLGDTVIIMEDKVVIGENTYSVIKVREETVSREVFEEAWCIHDGLSIYDENIKVIYIECEDGTVIPVVPVNENRVIIPIELGWFMLEST